MRALDYSGLTPDIMGSFLSGRNNMLALQQAQREQQAQQLQAQRETIGRGAIDLLQLPEEKRSGQQYKNFRDKLIATGTIDPAQIPEDYTPDVEDHLKRLVRAAQPFDKLLQNQDTFFSGTGIMTDAARSQFDAYKRAGLPDQEARQRAINDALQAKTTTYIDPLGNVVRTAAQPLPPVGGALGAAQQAALPVQAPLAEAAQQPSLESVPTGQSILDRQQALTPQPPQEPPIAQAERFKARAAASEKRRGDIIQASFDAAQAAQGIAESANLIESNLDTLAESGAATGPASGVITFLNDLSAQLGLDVNINDASSLTQIEALSNKIATPLTKQLGVNPTDRDFNIIKSTVARAGTSMQANYALIDVMRQSARRQKDKNEIVMQAQEEGLNEVQMKRRLGLFDRARHVNEPVPLPESRKNLKRGGRYVTPRGVFIFDGRNFNRAR